MKILTILLPFIEKRVMGTLEPEKLQLFVQYEQNIRLVFYIILCIKSDKIKKWRVK